MSAPHHGMFSHPRQDIIAGSVVFLVAVPLCLGIAVACGLPPITGLVAGIAGGLVAPWLSRAPQSVTGPAAGLTAIVLAEVQTLGGISPFLTAVMLAGVMQVVFGALRFGRFAALVPSAVIKGMLGAIGITIILKQIPAALGATGSVQGVFSQITAGPTILALLSLAILVVWPRTPAARITWLSAPLVVVVVTSLLALAMAQSAALALAPAQFVRIPLGSPAELVADLPRPSLAALPWPATWLSAITVAIVASLETLLSLQAIDRLDPLKRRSDPNRELLAQGAANLVSGGFGGLPVTAVIVRGGANVAAGGRERLSALVHGVLLLLTVLVAASLLNRIPLAALAAILIFVGFGLCAPRLVRTQYRLGLTQFLPYVVTIATVLATDLLLGVCAGVAVSLMLARRRTSHGTLIDVHAPDGTRTLQFANDGSFVAKPTVRALLDTVPDGATLIIDGAGRHLDHDVCEVLAEFVRTAPDRAITVDVRGIDLSTVDATGAH